MYKWYESLLWFVLAAFCSLVYKSHFRDLLKKIFDLFIEIKFKNGKINKLVTGYNIRLSILTREENYWVKQNTI